MFRFAHPQWLWLLAAVPALVFAQIGSFQRRRRRLARLGDPALIARMSPAVSLTRQGVRAGCAVLALALLVLALARPQLGGRARLQKQLGLDLVVALDFSKSMLARDVYPSRLERAKRELETLMDGLAGDRVGLVAFAGETLSYPPTTDYAAVKLFWRDLQPADLPVGGTAIGRALRASLDLLIRLREQGGKSRAQVVLLLTDGEDTDSEPLEVADEAARLGIKIYAVGIGSPSGELIPQVGEDGSVQGYLKDADGKYVTSRLAEGLLGELARRTEGLYLRADARRFGVEAIASALQALARTEDEARLVKEYDELYLAALWPAFLLLAIELALRERRRASDAPGAVTPATVDTARRARPAPAPPLAALGLLLCSPALMAFDVLSRPDPDVAAGNRALAAGQAEAALEHYDRAAARGPADAGAELNRGLALSALGRHDEAVQAFLQASRARDPALRARAFYNLGNAFARGEKWGEAVEAYKRALTLDGKQPDAKWNLELALRKRQEQRDQQKQDQQKDDDQSQRGDRQKQGKQDQGKQDQGKQDQGKQDQGEQDQGEQDQGKQDQGEQPSEEDPAGGQPPPEPRNPGEAQERREEPRGSGEPPDQAAPPSAAKLRAIDAILDSLDRSPVELERNRAQLRAIRQRPPAKDW